MGKGKDKFEILYEHGESTILAGSTIKGSLFIHIHKDLHGAEMTLTFLGAEKTKVRHAVGVNNTGAKTEMGYTYGSRMLVRVDLPVHESNLFDKENGKLKAGKYRIPFSVATPSHLPSSVSILGGGGHANIEYSMKAVLKGEGELWNLSIERKVKIMARPLKLNPSIAFRAPPTTEEAKKMIGMNRGTISVGAYVDNTRVDKGGSSKMSLSCRNNSRIRIHEITVNFIEDCRWLADEHMDSTHRALATLHFGVLTGMDPVGRLARMPDMSEAQIFEEIYTDLEDGIHSGSINLPVHAHCSYDGALMSIDHYLEIKIRPERYSMIDSPTIRIPLQLGEPRDDDPSEHDENAAKLLPELAQNKLKITDSFKKKAAAMTPIETTLKDIILGGKPTEDREPDLGVKPTIYANLMPPSMKRLIHEMDESVEHAYFMKETCEDPDWETFFYELTPKGFAEIISKVGSDFDIPDVARTMASAVRKFKWTFLVAAAEASPAWIRPSVVEQLLPKCKDLHHHHDDVLKSISSWDRMVTEEDFAEALRKLAEAHRRRKERRRKKELGEPVSEHPSESEYDLTETSRGEGL